MTNAYFYEPLFFYGKKPFNRLAFVCIFAVHLFMYLQQERSDEKILIWDEKN